MADRNSSSETLNIGCHSSVASAKEVDFDFYRNKIKWFLEKHQYLSALFWADKVASLTKDDQKDIYTVAQCLYFTKQYHRAAHCIESRNLHKTDLTCRYLAASSRFAGKEYKEALEILEQPAHETSILEQRDATEQQRLESSLQLLQGKIYEAMDNRTLAAECYKKALRLDMFCYEAFEALVKHQMLSREAEEEVLNTLSHNTTPEGELVRLLYATKVKKYDKPAPFEVPAELHGLRENLDVATGMAEQCYYNCDYKRCYEITSSVLNKDPFHTDCLPVHISCLMELGKSNALFYLAHRLVDMYPESAISWFAVGCYYFLNGKADAARRFLSKATVLDQVFGPAWLVYGHSFAVENEHDQAMAAYFKALQLMRGCHLPFLYIGLEYGLTNSTKLAERFFNQALAIAPHDPFVLHELGVVAFQSQDYAAAKNLFENALGMLGVDDLTVLPQKWEPLLNNLGHTCRKLRKFPEALEYHQQALVLSPQNPSTLAAIGFIHSLTRDWAKAVEYFHKALGLQRDDTFSTTMLSHMIERLMNEMPPCQGVPDVLPEYSSTSDSHVNEFSDMDPTNTTCPSLEFEMEGND
ncbi:cell division cycle protein 16 homolog [Ornithodoros turicata]|uniref:cell division cycle protein 16 homolog n=1 Tax=Ornithodoros turicata TaxID=34597 RepID=UPI003139E7B0